MSKILNISEEYLDELIDYCGRNLVGKTMKRFEIVDNRDTLKKEIRELVYEGFRYFKDLLDAHTRGLNITQFHFKREKDLIPKQE